MLCVVPISAYLNENVSESSAARASLLVFCSKERNSVLEKAKRAMLNCHRGYAVREKEVIKVCEVDLLLCESR